MERVCAKYASLPTTGWASCVPEGKFTITGCSRALVEIGPKRYCVQMRTNVGLWHAAVALR